MVLTRRGSSLAALVSLVIVCSVEPNAARGQTPDQVNDCDIALGKTIGDPVASQVCRECNWDVTCACARLPDRCKQTPKVATNLSLAVTLQLDARAVEGARVSVLAGASTLESVTDASGDARFALALGVPRPAKLTVKSVALSGTTKLPGVMFPKGFVMPVDREVPLAAGDTSKRVAVTLPTAKLVVTPLSYDSNTGKWSSAPARVELVYGKSAFHADVGPAATTIPLLIPPGAVGKEYRVQAATTDGTRLRDTVSLRVPAPGATAFLSLYLADLPTQLERARFRLNQMLVQAYGKEVADRITKSVVFTLSADATTPSYKNGVITVPKVYSLGSLDEAENLFHEWGHRVQEVLAYDRRVDWFSAGGKTEGPWAPDPEKNEWRAFDEARANFYSQLFTAALRYPGDRTYTEAAAKPHIGKCANCPGVLAAAMVTHYRDPALYGNALEIARDLRAVNDEGAATLGHPPRTYAEFVKAKESLLDRQRAAGAITAERAEAIKKQLRETNARFKL